MSELLDKLLKGGMSVKDAMKVNEAKEESNLPRFNVSKTQFPEMPKKPSIMMERESVPQEDIKIEREEIQEDKIQTRPESSISFESAVNEFLDKNPKVSYSQFVAFSDSLGYQVKDTFKVLIERLKPEWKHEQGASYALKGEVLNIKPSTQMEMQSDFEVEEHTTPIIPPLVDPFDVEENQPIQSDRKPTLMERAKSEAMGQRTQTNPSSESPKWD